MIDLHFDQSVVSFPPILESTLGKEPMTKSSANQVKDLLEMVKCNQVSDGI